MPAIYSIDLIEKRDKKLRMDRSIIKRWNVHYQTLTEVEEEARLKQPHANEEVSLQEPFEEDDSNADSEQIEQKEDPHAHAYNRKTGAYSGHYGKDEVDDEDVKNQIHAILNEKKDVFGSAMSVLQKENNAVD